MINPEPDTTTAAAAAAAGPICCGEKPVGVAGKPLVNSCQLCPKSPTYWRKRETAE